MLYTCHVAYLSCLTWWLIWWYVILDCYICAKSWLVCVCESICMPVLEALRTGRQIKYVFFLKKILCSSVIFFDWHRNIRLTFLGELRNIRFPEKHKLLYSSGHMGSLALMPMWTYIHQYMFFGYVSQKIKEYTLCSSVMDMFLDF
jgi:hypothetical protein